MFFPISTDRRLKHMPWVNYSLIAINAIIFLLTKGQIALAQQLEAHIANLQKALESHQISYAHAISAIRESVARLNHIPVLNYYLDPQHAHVYQFITYQFLHANWTHIIGNMIFLYVFGCAVEDKMGKVAYFFFYLAAGVIAGIGHCLIEPASVLGASGAIAGVTGAYLAFFPLSNITVVYFFFLIGAFEVPGIVLVLFEVGVNAYSQFTGGGHVAYLAHLFGYGTGFAVGMTLLLTNLLPREHSDMLALIKQKRRRATFRRMANSGYHAWEGAPQSYPHGTASAAPPSPEQARLMQDRSTIADAISKQNLPAAAHRYRELIARDPNQVMSQQVQLDIANQLMSESAYQEAAHAYELFLKTYASYPQKEQVQLILGLIYAKYLNQPGRARELLTQSIERLDAGNRQLAEQTLESLE